MGFAGGGPATREGRGDYAVAGGGRRHAPVTAPPAASPPVARKLSEALKSIVGFCGSFFFLLVKKTLFKKITSQTKLGRKGSFSERLALQSPECPTLSPAGAAGGLGAAGTDRGSDRSYVRACAARRDRALASFVAKRKKVTCIPVCLPAYCSFSCSVYFSVHSKAAWIYSYTAKKFALTIMQTNMDSGLKISRLLLL